ncbi:MAG: YggT family protein [Spirochaetota bacterium]
MAIVRMIMQLLSIVLSIYSFIIFIRIILTWFQPGSEEFGQVGEFLARITDPYLNWFRGIEFLRVGGIDFSVIAALIVLWVAQSIAFNIAAVGTITFGMILAIVVSAIANALFFFLTLFLILAVIRLLGSLLGANTAGRFWIVVDQLIEPLVHRVVTPLARGRFVSYRTALIVFAALDFGAILLGRFLASLLVGVLRSLPF